MHRFEKARERSGALPIGNVSRVCRHDEAIIGGTRPPPNYGRGVGVDDGKCDAYFFSIAARIC
jgi:hypothetical protein